MNSNQFEVINCNDLLQQTGLIFTQLYYLLRQELKQIHG